jgi:hypothetical protein
VRTLARSIGVGTYPVSPKMGDPGSVWDLLPVGKRIKGANIAMRPNQDYNLDCALLWGNWEWDAWLKPQIDVAKNLGANTIRLYGTQKARIAASGYTPQLPLSTYLDRWEQFFNYLRSQGMYAYPCMGFDSAIFDARYGWTPDVDVLAAEYAQVVRFMVKHRDIIFGVDLANESVGWANQTAAGKTQTNGTIVYRACKDAAPGLRFTWSMFFVRAPTPPVNFPNAGSYDYIDVHLYYGGVGDVSGTNNPLETDLDNTLAYYANTPVLVGEFGMNMQAGATARQNRYSALRDLANHQAAGGARLAGVEQWAIGVQDSNALNDWGIADGSLNVRSDVQAIYASFPTTLATLRPAPPTNVAAVGAATQVTVSWTGSNMGEPTTTDYAVQYRLTDTQTWSTFAHAPTTATSLVVTGLTNLEEYDFRVAAVNDNGSSIWSATVIGVPVAASPSVPGKPRSVTALPGNTQATVSWLAPASNGGAALSDYTVQYRIVGAGSWTTFAHAASTATSIVVTGLVNGSIYEFQVAAVNAQGTGSFALTTPATPSTATIYAADDFNRADAAVLGSTSTGAKAYTVAAQGTGTPIFGIKRGRAYAAKGTTGQYDVNTQATFDAAVADNFTIGADVGDSPDQFGLAIRAQDANNLIFLVNDVTAGDLQLYKIVATATTKLSGSSGVGKQAAIGDRIEVSVAGHVYTVKKNGVTQYAITNAGAEFAAITKHGIRTAAGRAPQWDNLRVTA